jgi:hypothetical protein
VTSHAIFALGDGLHGPWGGGGGGVGFALGVAELPPRTMGFGHRQGPVWGGRSHPHGPWGTPFLPQGWSATPRTTFFFFLNIYIFYLAIGGGRTILKDYGVAGHP